MPNSVWVAQFLGLGNVIEGQVVNGKKVETKIGTFSMACKHKHQAGEKVQLLVRPLELGNEVNQIRGRVVDVVFQQDKFKVTLDDGLYFYIKDEPKVGQMLEIKIKLECLR